MPKLTKYGNPYGRPKSVTSITQEIKEYVKHHPAEVKAVIASLFQQAIKGNLTATKEILDRVDGRVIEKHMNLDVPITLIFQPAQTTNVIEGQLVRQIEQETEKNND